MSDTRDHEACCQVDGDPLRSDLSDTALELAAVGFSAIWRGRPVRPVGLLPGRDALAAEATAALVQDCPTCRHTLTVDIASGIPSDDTTVLWLPDSADGNLIANFCARAELYCSPEHLHQNIDTARTPGVVADLTMAVSLGCDIWADVAGVNLDEATSW